MASDEITKEIGTLVDHLRAGNDEKISLTDIASATEVLLQATQMYFRNIDTTIFRQVQTMSDLISAMRTDIAQLRPEDLKDEDIPRAGLELDAIVRNTEEATNAIMEAAEEIMSADLSDPGTATQEITDSCMRIFEACSFQDITGQRVDKVVKTLTQIENRLESLRGDWAEELGLEENSVIDRDSEADTRPDAHLLHGPALGGEGANQSEIDALMSADTDSKNRRPGTIKESVSEKVESPTPRPTPTEEAKTTDATPEQKAVSAPPIEPKAEAKPKTEKKPKTKVEEKPKPKPKVEETPKPKAEEKPKVAKVAEAPEPAVDDDDEGETASQSDIDALFD